MPNLIKNLKEALTITFLVICFLNILTNFKHIVLQSARKLNRIFFRKGILQIKWVSHNLMSFSWSILFIIHDQLFSFKFNVLRTRNRTALKKKTGRINLINTWLIITSSLLKYLRHFSMKQHILKIKHSSPDSIQKCLDEVVC